MLKAVNLSYKYQNKDYFIFQELSFAFNKRNIVHIKGENGCGKSTLFYCLSGFITAYLGGELGGELLINNKDFENLSLAERLKYVNLLFQDPEAQINFANVYDEMHFLLKQTQQLSVETEMIIKEYLQLFNLDINKNSFTHELSWGQKKIVCLINLIVNDPQIYLLDEPFAGLSERHSCILRDILYKKRNENRLILITDHSSFSLDYNQELILRDYARN